METFLKVVDAGSFTTVANAFNTTQSSISKRVSWLEKYLGVKLLQRTTRKISLTDEGKRYHHDCREILERIEQCESQFDKTAIPSGLIRVTAPTSLSHKTIFPNLKRFTERFPDIQVSLNITDSFVDLVEQNMDLSIRVGELTDSSMIAKRIGTARRVAVATPEYIKKRGTPNSPTDLSKHQCISNFKTWGFKKENEPCIDVEVNGKIQTNSPEGVRQAVLSSLGIAVSPIWLFAEDISSGRLVILLDDYEPEPLPINVIYPSRLYLPNRVSAFIEFISDEFQLNPWVSSYGIMKKE